MTDDAFERAVRREHVGQARMGFRIHFGVYVAVQAMLFAIWALTPHGAEVLPWFVYPLLGWGVGVLAHYLAVRSTLRSRPPSA